jgi:chaperone BCS1
LRVTKWGSDRSNCNLDLLKNKAFSLLRTPTNHPQRLDPALVRPGRVDRKIELGPATPDQARRLFLWFYQGCGIGPAELARHADSFAAQVPPGRLTMAAIQEHLLRHRRTPEVAAHEAVFEDIETGGEEIPAARPERAEADCSLQVS